MVESQVFWMNIFHAEDGVLKELSPRYLITGVDVDYNCFCRMEFGTYV
jgi:hypothetical protein